MPVATATRKKLIALAGRLAALRAESVSSQDAVRMLVAEGTIPAHATIDPDLPLSSAIQHSVPADAARIADYTRAGEGRGQGEDVLRFLSQLGPQARRWSSSFAAMGVEFAILLVVVTTYSLFVLPQLRAVFQTFGAELPRFTQIVFTLVSSSEPVMWLVAGVLVIGVIWRLQPAMLGPLTRILDRSVLVLPGIGSVIRQNNSICLSGWLGFSAPDAHGQRVALETARTWSVGILARQCAEALAQADRGREISASLVELPGFDREFRLAVAMSDQTAALKSLRARWRFGTDRQTTSDPLAAAIVHFALGIVVAALVVAMYLPIFKLGTLS